MTLFGLIAGMGKAVLPPTNLTATVDGSDIDLTWTAASGAESYNVYQSIDGGDWTLVDNEATTAYTVTPTEPGEYNFRVTSVKGDDESDPSNETTTTESMMVQVYTDTLSPRISAVDGTAFVDNVSDIVGYADGNHLLEIEDSSGNVISAVLKEQGSGETLGSEEVTNGDFSAWSGGDPNGWSENTSMSATVDAGGVVGDCAKLENTGGFSARLSQDITGISKNGLFKHSMYQKNDTDGLFLCFGNTTAGEPWFFIDTVSNADWTEEVRYATSIDTTLGLRPTLGATIGNACFIDEMSIKQVLTPSTSGCILVDEISGTTESLYSADAGFDYNESSYTVTVKQILPT